MGPFCTLSQSECSGTGEIMNKPGIRVNMDRAVRRRYLTGFIVLYVIWAVTYTAIGAWTSTMRTHSLETALDRAIPFIRSCS